MEQQWKPLHLITNLLPAALYKEAHYYGITIECSARHKQGEPQEHVHAYLTWPIGITTKQERCIQPRRATFVKKIRRNYGCSTCHNTSSGERCPNCNLYLKFIWPHDQAHVDNIKAYIKNPATETIPISKELEFRGHYSERNAAEEILYERSTEDLCGKPDL